MGIIAGREVEVETEERVMTMKIEEDMMTREDMKTEEVMMIEEAMKKREIMMTENIIPKDGAEVKAVIDIVILVTMMIITMIMININIVRIGGGGIIDELSMSLYVICILFVAEK